MSYKFHLNLQSRQASQLQNMCQSMNRVLIAGKWIITVLAIVFIGLGVETTEASAQSWSLTKTQRQGYLYYYAPIILKRGDENNNKEGRDWITNFDFDQDGNFANNRVNWRNVNQYVAGSYTNWRIRPTLYSALIEYMEGNIKSLVLLYHVYHGTDKDGDKIHDWERVEISIRNISGTPGGGSEYVNHVTVTRHREHIMRRYYDSGLNFMQTTTGKHVLLWQADESGTDYLVDVSSAHEHELRYVTNPYSTISSQINSSTSNAEVNINEKSNKHNVHYVFVPEGSSAAVTAWRAQPLNYNSRSVLASRVDNGNTVKWTQVKRITYELQDLADIFPTNWQSSTWYIHWVPNSPVDILLESPITNELGQAEVGTGLQRFYTQSRDIGQSNLTDGRDSFLSKQWLYGTYAAELNSEPPYDDDDFTGFEGLGVDSYGRTRGAASGYLNSHNSFWWQHDFFVHSGFIDSATNSEAGIWLAGSWYLQSNGGFDGRWVQLFDDRPGSESGNISVPLNVSILYPRNLCDTRFLITAISGGGQNPHTFTWVNATPLSPGSNQAYVSSGVRASITVRDATGQALTVPIDQIDTFCGSGDQIP